MKKGTVKFFNETKGFGFITVDGENDVFVHAKDLNGLKLKEGDKVSFNVVDGKKGTNAANVELI